MYSDAEHDAVIGYVERLHHDDIVLRLRLHSPRRASLVLDLFRKILSSLDGSCKFRGVNWFQIQTHLPITWSSHVPVPAQAANCEPAKQGREGEHLGRVQKGFEMLRRIGAFIPGLMPCAHHFTGR